MCDDSFTYFLSLKPLKEQYKLLTIVYITHGLNGANASSRQSALTKGFSSRIGIYHIGTPLPARCSLLCIYKGEGLQKTCPMDYWAFINLC